MWVNAPFEELIKPDGQHTGRLPTHSGRGGPEIVSPSRSIGRTLLSNKAYQLESEKPPSIGRSVERFRAGWSLPTRVVER